MPEETMLAHGSDSDYAVPDLASLNYNGKTLEIF